MITEGLSITKKEACTILAFIAIICFVEILSLGRELNDYTVLRPREAQGLLAIATTWTIHLNYVHLMQNVVTTCFFIWPAALISRKFELMLPILIVVPGISMWLFATMTYGSVGLSGVTFALNAYVTVYTLIMMVYKFGVIVRSLLPGYVSVIKTREHWISVALNFLIFSVITMMSYIYLQATKGGLGIDAVIKEEISYSGHIWAYIAGICIAIAKFIYEYKRQKRTPKVE